MLVEARKLEHKPLFARTPLQSDYVTEWSAAQRPDRRATQAHRSQPRTWRNRVSALMPRSLRVMLIGWAQQRRYSLANRDFYRKVP